VHGDELVTPWRKREAISLPPPHGLLAMNPSIADMDRAWFGPRGRGKRATTRVQNRAAHAPDDRRGLRPRDCTKGRQAQQRADQSGRSPRRITESHSSQTLAREQIAATAATVATRVVHRHGVAAQRFSNHAPAVTSATRSAGGATAAPRSRPSRAEPSRAEPSRAEPSRAEPSRAETVVPILWLVRRKSRRGRSRSGGCSALGRMTGAP
jgi:hypothetical protein